MEVELEIAQCSATKEVCARTGLTCNAKGRHWLKTVYCNLLTGSVA